MFSSTVSLLALLILSSSSSDAFQPRSLTTRIQSKYHHAAALTTTQLHMAEQIQDYKRGLNKIDNKDSSDKVRLLFFQTPKTKKSIFIITDVHMLTMLCIVFLL